MKTEHHRIKASFGERFDSFIAAVAPERALRRDIARYHRREFNAQVRPGYNSGAYGTRRRTNVYPSIATEDALPSMRRDYMVANAMDLYRNNPLCRSIVDVIAGCLGESEPHAATSDAEWNKTATAWFNEVWWPQADARGRAGVTFGTMQKVWTKATYFMGDQLFALFDGQLFPYEGMQIKTPSKLGGQSNVVAGIRTQKAPPQRVTHYYVMQPSSGHVSNQDFKRIRASNAIFAPSEPWRTNSLRGIPYLHGVIDALHDLGASIDNIQQKQKFESMWLTFGKKGALGRGIGRTVSDLDSTKGTKITANDTAWGMHGEIDGDMKDFKFAEMTTPSGEAMAWIQMAARLIAAGVGVPYEVVMHTYLNSYTASRASRTDFKAYLMQKWEWRNKVLNQRVWNWRIAKAIRAGDLPAAPVNEQTGMSEWHKVRWTKPHLEQIDQGKEVTADIKQWGAGQESIEDWAQQRGTTREALLNAHDEDVREMLRRSKELGVDPNFYMQQLLPATAGETTNQTGTS